MDAVFVQVHRYRPFKSFSNFDLVPVADVCKWDAFVCQHLTGINFCRELGKGTKAAVGIGLGGGVVHGVLPMRGKQNCLPACIAILRMFPVLGGKRQVLVNLQWLDLVLIKSVMGI